MENLSSEYELNKLFKNEQKKLYKLYKIYISIIELIKYNVNEVSYGSSRKNERNEYVLNTNENKFTINDNQDNNYNYINNDLLDRHTNKITSKHIFSVDFSIIQVNDLYLQFIILIMILLYTFRIYDKKIVIVILLTK